MSINYYSADDLMRLSFLPENEIKHLELKDGVLLETPVFGFHHGVVCANFCGLFGNYVLPNRLGKLLAGGTGYTLHKSPDGRDTVRAPDMGFIRPEHIPPEGLTDDYFPGAPDIAVEVVQWDDNLEWLLEKIEDYLYYGTQMVIVAYLETESVEVYTPNGMRRLTLDDTLDVGDVLPGLSIPVRQIFE